MVSDLANGVKQILLFAERAIEDALYDDADLLEKVIGKMYELIVETATFVCNYTKRSIAGEYATLGSLSFGNQLLGQSKLSGPRYYLKTIGESQISTTTLTS